MAPLRDGELFHTILGDGPTMLMMHGGLGLDHTYLRPLHDQLSSDVRLVYYDHRANGRSARGVGAADHALWQDDAASLLDRLGDRRAIIYGHSYGAWLALGFAVRYPERVSALVLCGAAPAFDYASDVFEHVQAGDPKVAQIFMSSLTSPPNTDDEFGEIWLGILPLYFHGQPHPGAFERTSYSAEGSRLGIDCMARYNLCARLPELRVPTLLLAGAHDFITPATQARRIASAVPTAHVVEFAKSGHFPFLEEPTTYLDQLHSWLLANVAGLQ